VVPLATPAELQVSDVSVRRWITLLENLFVVFRVLPFSKNIARSLLKAPKIYFYDVARVSSGSGVAATAQAFGRTPSLENLETSLWANYQHGLGLKALDLEWADAMMNQVCRSVGPFFQHHDILLTPTIGVTPYRLGVLDANAPGLDAQGWYDHLFRHLPYTALFNMTGHPAISLPLGQSAGGLPIGIQLVGRYGDEATVLKLAAQLEQAMPWAARLPGVHATRAN
jgi:amidase